MNKNFFVSIEVWCLGALYTRRQGINMADTALSARDVEILPILTEEKKK
jgi:hypothetical protein